ncbi:hypothetical protein ACWEWG_25730 [Streptomyces sp. NPDC003758]
MLELPRTWLEQTKPGGIVLVTLCGWLYSLCGWLYSSELARLTVGDDGTARGRLLGGQVSFMLARPQMPPALGILPDLQDGEERGARLGAGVLDDWTARFVAELAAPRAQRISLSGADGPEYVLVDVEARRLVCARPARRGVDGAPGWTRASVGRGRGSPAAPADGRRSAAGTLRGPRDARGPEHHLADGLPSRQHRRAPAGGCIPAGASFACGVTGGECSPPAGPSGPG